MTTRALLALAFLLAGCPEAEPEAAAHSTADPGEPAAAADTAASDVAPPAERVRVPTRGLPAYDCIHDPSWPTLLHIGRAAGDGPVLLNECWTAFRPSIDGGWEQLPAPVISSPTGRARVRVDAEPRRIVLLAEGRETPLPEGPPLWGFARDDVLCGGEGRTVTCVDVASGETTEHLLPEDDELLAVLPSPPDGVWVLAGIRFQGFELPTGLDPTSTRTGYKREREPQIYVLGRDEPAATVPLGQVIDYHPIRDRWLVLDAEELVVLDDAVEQLRMPAKPPEAYVLAPRFSHDGSRFCATISGVSPRLTSPCFPIDER